MSSVSHLPQSSAHVVVARSRWAAAFGLLSALSWPLEALAAPTDAAGAPMSQHELPAAPRADSYRGLLTTSYVLAPFAALGVGHLLSEAETDDTVAVIGGSAMFLAPAGVHMAHGNVTHGPLAFLGLAGSTGVSL